MRQNRWLHDWVDEIGVTDDTEAEAAIRSPQGWQRLLEHAATHDSEPELSSLGKRSIAAGRAMDLTAFLACGHPDCLTAQVDSLFARVWHYFDQIAVVGADAHLLMELVESDRPDRARSLMASMVRVLLHARNTGAEKFLVFTDKPPACRVHWPEYEENDSLRIPTDVLIPIADDMLKNGKVSLVRGHCRKCGDRFVYRGRGPSSLRNSVPAARVLDRRLPGMTVDEAAVLSVLEKYAMGAASDLYASEELGVPLGAGIPLEAQLLETLRPTATEAQIAFSLQLPVVEGLSIKELLAVREEEGDAFEAFRVTLQQAMGERLKEDGSKAPEKIAADIEDQLLEPALVALRQRLKATERTLQRKHAVHSGVAGLATICGLLGEPAAASALALATTASATKAEFSAIEERTAVESDRMYFLWKIDHKVRQNQPARKKRRRRR